MRDMISWSVQTFFSLFMTFKTNFRMSIIPPPHVLFLYVLYSQWFFNRSIDKNQIQFPSKCTKQREKKLTGKNLNVYKQYSKDVICVFWRYSVYLRIFRKNRLLTSPLQWSNEQLFIYHLFLFTITSLPTQPLLNQWHLLLEK